jgi:glycosyltransferase involved in cell wall biosynthesis
LEVDDAHATPLGLDDPNATQMKPVLFVTGHAPPDRIGAFARLHELENVEFALFGGRSKHGTGAFAGELPFPHRHIRQHEPATLATSGRYRAVVCSTGGRVALGATWVGARRSRLPLILWTSLWAHPRSAAHALSFLALRRLYRSADAVVTYGPHVSAYVRARGAHNVHAAPQAVDNSFWSAPDVDPPRWPTPGATGSAAGGRTRSGRPEQATTKFLFVGRPAREKGLRVLTEAWRTTGLQTPPAALVLVGVGSSPPWVPTGGAAGDARGDILWMDPVPPLELRNLYAACDVLVVPSIATRTFREPWGLVVNEAMNRGLPVIASDTVGAVAGGLIRDGHNGLVVPAGDSDALAAAIDRLAGEPALRARLGGAGAEDVRAFTYDAWAGGFSGALAGLGLSRRY